MPTDSGTPIPNTAYGLVHQRQERSSLATMTITEFELVLHTEFSAMVKLLIGKRKSYGTNNLTRFGGMGIVIRASDKIDRLVNMYKGSTTASADGDTMEDAWRDLIGYGVLGLLHHLEEQRDRAHQTESSAEGESDQEIERFTNRYGEPDWRSVPSKQPGDSA